MSARPKFLFNDDFGAPRKPAEPGEPTLSASQHADALRQTDEAAYLRGVAEGRRQAEADDAARISASMQRLALHFTEAAGHFAHIAGKAEQQAARLALIMAKKLAATLVARQPLAEIEAVAKSVFSHLRSTPHAVVRVEASLVDAVKTRLDLIAREAGFTGTIVVLGEPDMAAGDARVEWADGGASRDMAATEAMLDEIVRRYLAANRREETRP
jgi:flagellar assembly protein FliH